MPVSTPSQLPFIHHMTSLQIIDLERMEREGKGENGMNGKEEKAHLRANYIARFHRDEYTDNSQSGSSIVLPWGRRGWRRRCDWMRRTT